jgi:membrane protease YdiL (CAAX protease family)
MVRATSMKTFAFRWLAVVLGMLLAHPLAAAELPAPEPVKTLSPAYSRYLEMSARTKQLLKDRDTKGLEALAAELRTSKDALDGGTWMLSYFYDMVDTLPDKEAEAGEAMKFFEQWAAESPQSITAQVALARALISYAWVARGSGWSNSVTDEGWKLFEKRLQRARDVLGAAKELDEKCPGWYEAGQTVALGQGWEWDEYMKFVDEAIAKEPTYGKYYTKACYWMLPRWYGEEGDFEDWIAEKADGYPEEKRDWQYARFVWMADRMNQSEEMVFKPGRLDWKRTKRGFEKWLETDPSNLNVRFEYTRLAMLADDPKTAREQFEITGGKYSPRQWGGVEEFEKARKYAYEGGANPLREDEDRPQRTPRSQISPKAIEWVEFILRIAGSFLGSALAGVLLLVLALQRNEPVAGTVAVVAALVVGTAFGTLATLVPGACLYLYFKKKGLVHPPELAPSSGWVVLGWLIVLASVPLALQVGAAILQMIPYTMKNGPYQDEKAMAYFMRDGSVMRTTVVTSWLGFLGLLIACGPRNREGWKRRLGLQGFRPGPAALWILGAAIVIGAMGFVADKYMDEYSKKSLIMIAEGIHSPVWYFLAVAIVAPISEELLFRGYAFSGWVEKITPWGAILAPAVLFTVCHLQYGWAGLLYVFVMGVTLGIVRWRTGSIYPCIALHAAYNLYHCIEVARRAWA